MHCRTKLLGLSCFLAAAISFAAPPAVSWDAGQKLMGQYCMDCHDADVSKGDLNLENLTKATVLHDYKLWENVLRMLEDHKMPPKKKKKQPSDVERDLLIAWVSQTLEQAAVEHAGDPGTVTMRRLNNAEYDYTIKDLTGIYYGLAEQFPGDAGGGEGFSNTGDVLFMSPEHLDKYLVATRKLVNHATIMPGSGIQFHEREVGLRGPDMVKSDVERPLRNWYQKAAAPIIPARLDQLREADYCLACWRFKHRDLIGETTLDQLARERKLDPDFLQNWWKFLTTDVPESRYLDLTRHAWRELPPPDPDKSQEVPEAVLAGVKRIQAQRQSWYRENVQRRQQDVNAEKPYPAKVVLRGQQQVHLVATEGGDGNKGDVMVWSQIKFKVKGKWVDAVEWIRKRKTELASEEESKDSLNTESSKDPKTQTPEPPNAQTSPSELQLINDVLALLGKDAHGKKIDGKSIGVQAPSVITFPVPDGAQEFTATGRMDITGPDSDWGTMQFVAVAGERPAPPPVIPGHLTIWKRLSPGKEAFWKHFAPLRTVFQDTHDRRLLEVQQNFNRRWPINAVYYLSKEQLIARLPSERTEPLMRMQSDWDCMGMLEDADLNWYRNKVGLTAGWGKEPKKFEELSEEEQKKVTELTEKRKKKKSEWDDRVVEHLLGFAHRAWRRPLTDAEKKTLTDRYHAFRSEDHGPEPAGRLVLQRVLMSPHFLYRVETAGKAGAEHPVTSLELATRLSYLLWSSTRDAALSAIAESGNPMTTEELVTQTQRMLKDRKSERLANEFVGQWLEFKGFREHSGVDKDKFPEFTSELREDMFRETKMFVADLIQRDGSILDLLHANYTFLNERLAGHYGIPGVKGNRFEKTSVGKHHRGGLLGMGSILTKTSFPLRTSPVVRGHWLLNSVLGTPTPPPPADVPPLPEEESIAKTQTVRQRLEAHRNKPQCATCHDRIDPLGFALENFDPLGRWREKDSHGHPIDNSAVIREGPTFKGIDGLRSYLKSQQDQFLKQFCTKFIGYALGRSVMVSDRQLMDAMIQVLRENQFKFSAAVIEVVKSRQFRNRKN